MLTSGLISLLVFFLVLSLGVVVLVFGLILLVSYLGGWGALARSYAVTPETNKGTILEEKVQYKAWVGLNRFGTLVTARSYERGVELEVRFPFSPPLFFPWEAISEYERVNLLTLPQVDQFTVSGRRIRLSNHLEELGKRKGGVAVG